MVEITAKMQTGVADEQTGKSRPPRQAGRQAGTD